MSDGKRKINTNENNNKYNANKSQNKNNSVKVKEDNKKKEITAVILIAAGLFLFLSLFKKTGAFGRFIIGILYGLFGYIATIIVICTAFVLAWCLLRGTEKSVFNTRTTILFVLFGLVLSAFIHTLATNFARDYASLSFFQVVDKLWTSGSNIGSGGIIGGGISCILQIVIEKAGTLVILIPALLIISIVLFSFSIVTFAKKSAGHFKVAGNWIKSVKERFVTESKAKRENKHELKGKQESNETKKPYRLPQRNKKEYEHSLESTQSKIDAGFSDMTEDHMDFEFESTANKKAFKASNTIENNEAIYREDNPEVIKTVLPGINDDAADTVPQEMPKLSDNETIKITTSKFDTTYNAPPFVLLNSAEETEDMNAEHRRQAAAVARKLEQVMQSFGIEAKVIHISRGSSVTQYELQPHSGVKVSRIKSLSDDIALNLAAPGIRIEAPIPGKAAVGIEIPNESVQTVYLRELIETDAFLNHKSGLAFCLGEEISGKPIIADIAKMPHLLIAGSTGSGKSVCINCMVMSILYKASPDDVRMIMIDPKVVELGVYNGIPHLLIPVVTEPRKAAAALAWAVQEMENRYKQFAVCGLRDINSYNSYAYERGMDKMPRILIIIDELADLMMVARDSVEDAINRIAAKARAAGIHLVVATQRPSVDVITGLIKANIPSRIAFKVASQVDSRTILDFAGAEKLMGRGDMLYHPVGAMQSTRAQGGFVSDEEIENVVKYLQTTYGTAEYDKKISEEVENAKIPEKGKKGAGASAASGSGDSDVDDLFYDALQIAIDAKQISASFLQRKLGLGYNRASRIIDQMEDRGYVSSRDGNNSRHVLISSMPEDI